ncbi:kinase-like domain-containing protein [Tanacetum coccineum]
MSLTWVRRLEICVGFAHALRYIHYDEPRDFSVIHRSIHSSSILLDDDWEPKLGDFTGSMKIKASERHRSFKTNKIRYTDGSTDGFTDPTYIETKRANHKSDMYCFGIVLFELLCGGKWVSNYFREKWENNHQYKYVGPVALFHFREKKFNEIDWDLWKQMDLHSFSMFAKIVYECLEEERSRRPNIDDIVPRLEKALELAHENRPGRAEPTQDPKL